MSVNNPRLMSFRYLFKIQKRKHGNLICLNVMEAINDLLIKITKTTDTDMVGRFKKII